MNRYHCTTCGEDYEPELDVCWRCGTHRDGTPPGPEFTRADHRADAPAAPRALDCLRCHTPMTHLGAMALHEGSRAMPFLFGNVGELFVNREHFDTYACPGCGKVEFFLAAAR
jgi:hypothetical protein